MNKDYEVSKESLRKQAEARLSKISKPVEDLTPEEVKALLHEYQVHQIELEIQNEELRDARQQLQSARDRYAELFNNAPLGYLIIDQAGIISQANKTFAAFIGLEPHNLSGKALNDLLMPSDRSAFHGRFKAFFKKPAGKELDFRLPGPSGELTVRCVGRKENEPQAPPSGEPSQRLLLAVSDISRQVRAEKVLREREQHLQAILETTQDGFWTLDMQGRVIEVNAAYCSMSGYKRDELLQMSIPDLEALESPGETESRIKRIIAAGGECFETKHRRKNGSLFDVEVSASYIEAGGG
ncbi:PAS domain S-box protein, partial [Desulfonatronospira sp.]|uniref:PAS domain-containing protein n=1 Tax=Desulfonatronospira sp. TaxID=1962951 RepID=UPI0025C15344